jgi:hypothetical protein
MEAPILGIQVLSPGLMGQASSKPETASPATTDRSQHHLIFSKPATAEKAELVKRDPRYRQQLRRQSPVSLAEAEIGGRHAPKLQSRFRVSHRRRKQGLDADWSEDMGRGATVGAMNFPAKYSFALRLRTVSTISWSTAQASPARARKLAWWLLTIFIPAVSASLWKRQRNSRFSVRLL